MSPFAVSPTRNRTHRRAARRTLQVESLERRDLLAIMGGNVTAQLVGSTLLLTGDAQSNQLAVASVTGGRIAVLGNNTTVNGSTDPFVTSRPVVSIIANLNGGDDLIGFGNTADGFADQLNSFNAGDPFNPPTLQAAINAVADGATTFSIPGGLTITGGTGDDAIGVIGNVGGSVAVNLGPSSKDGNGFAIGGDNVAYASRVGGVVSVVGGAQSDLVGIVRTTVVGGIATALGNGANGLYLSESTAASLAYTGGSGEDDVDVADARFRYGVSVATGGGDDEIYLHEHGGPRTIVGGGMVVDAGTGDDYVEISSGVSGGLTVATGAGDDEVDIYETDVGLSAAVDTLGGDDQVRISDTRVRFSLLVALGAGNDRLELSDVGAFAAFLYGGPGTNELDVDAASRAAIRRLFYAQFQTVVTT